MPPSASVVETAIVALSSPQNFTLTGPVAAGDFLSIVVGDGFGYSGIVLDGVTDSQGNIYNVDSAINEVDGDGSVYVAHGIAETALTVADHLTLTWSGGAWAHAYVIATPFTGGASGLEQAGTPHGLFTDPSTGPPVSVAVSAGERTGDLAIAYAVAQRGPVSLDLTAGWTLFLDNVGDADGLIAAAWLEAAATGTASTTATNANSGSDPTNPGNFGAAIVCTYSVGGGGGAVVGVPSVVSVGEVQAGVIRRPDFYP